MTSLLVNNLQKFQVQKGLILHKENEVLKVEKIKLSDNINTDLIG